MTEQPEKYFEWCLVANIVSEQPFDENHEIQHGTKHFSSNTKVYCSAPSWGDGYKKIVVEQAIDELFPHSQSFD